MSRSSNFLVSALQNAQALRKILQAFLRGGWKAAALEAVKRYWPYILGAAVGLILLPTIIMASLPSVMQGNTPDTLTDEDISEMYINRMDSILCISEVGSANEIRVVGQPLTYNELYAVCLALTGNNTEKITREFLLGCVNDSLTYTVEREGNNTGITTAVIRYLNLEEFSRLKGISEADIEWIGLVIKDLEDNKKSSPSGEE